ncbi:MAG: GLUG motif-containing protein, partial [Candidatus Limisoma sp.]
GDAWGQIIGFLDYPYLGSKKVYLCYEEGTCNVVYSNKEQNTTPTHSFDEKGFCTACGACKPAEIISASHHPEMCEKHNGYYAIECAGNLYWFAEKVNEGNTAINAVLAADIVDNEDIFNRNGIPVASGEFRQWTPIGYYNSDSDKLLYGGNFDGNGKTISGLYFKDSSRNYVGIFGANVGKIENIGILDSYFMGNNYVGSICGYNLGGVITNCYNHSYIEGSAFVSGICGSTTSSISNCYNIGSLKNENSNSYAICSDYTSGTITNCYCDIAYYDENNEGVTTFNAVEFKTGKVAYLLQGNQSTQVWGQTIGTNEYPVIFGAPVYYGYDCAGLKYSNEELPTTQPDHSYTVHGFCEVCHAHQEAKPVSETHHPELLDTHSGYYAIENGGQLCWFAESTNGSANAVLTDDVYINDFDLELEENESLYRNEFTQISDFSGKFDGNGHIISGLYMPTKKSRYGMFDAIEEGGEVFNFTLTNFYINGDDYSGAICSYNYGSIKDCSINYGVLVGADYFGGICGSNSGTISGCASNVGMGRNLEREYVGGISGSNNGTIDNCTNNSTVIGGIYVGGIVGKNTNTVTNCKATAVVDGNNYIGGVCGQNTGELNTCSHTYEPVTCGESYAGGICGYNEGVIFNCYKKYSVNAPTGVGGICGVNKGDISHCKYLAVGTLAGNDEVGGVCAKNYPTGTIEYCSAIGTIESLDLDVVLTNFGGVCGSNEGKILNCCSSSTIEGGYYIGGIAGENTSTTGIIANCYYNGRIIESKSGIGSICGYIRNATIAYCYYDSDYESTEAFPNSDLAENVVGKSSAEFRSGEVAYALQQGGTITANGKTITFDGDYWGQQLGADGYPVIDSDYKVLRAETEADSSYWTTFSDLSSDSELSVSSGKSLKVCNATVSAGKLTLTSRYNNQVAAGEGVLAKTDCQYLNAKHLDDTNLIAEEAELNNLVATPATEQTITADSGYLFYDLTYDSNGESLAFYLGQAKDANGNVTSSDGKKLTVSPGKAYLKVASSNAVDPATQAPAQILTFPDNIGTSGVDTITIGDNNNGRYEKDVIYDLWGRKVKNPGRGIYIRNGQKIVIR